MLAGRYKAIVCDVWGVLHNGVSGHASAGEALGRWRSETGTPVILLTNAPRNAAAVVHVLEHFGIPRDAYDAIITSGDVAQAMIADSGVGTAFYIGPDRDRQILDGTGVAITGEEEAKVVVCTGFADDDTETPELYRPLLARLVARGLPFICANPDIVVERGDRLVWCAGAIARLYEELGGTTITIGKPHAAIYAASLREIGRYYGGREPGPEEILAIGDGIPTDIKGASAQGMASLFITAGIHSAEFGPADQPDAFLVAERLAKDGLRPVAYLPRLIW